MGIGIDMGKKQNYSYLFQSLSSSGGGMGNLNFLSDYASIRNGSYGKLLKTYYAKQQDSGTETSSKESRSGSVLDRILEEKKNPKVSKEVQEALKSSLFFLYEYFVFIYVCIHVQAWFPRR